MLLLLIVVLTIVGMVLIQQPSTQTWIAGKATEYLSQKTGTKISVGSVEIGFFNKVILNEVFVEDQKKDTLAYIRSLDSRLSYFNPFNSTYHFNDLKLDGVRANIYRNEGDSIFNYQFLIDALSSLSGSKKSEKVADTTSSAKDPLDLKINNLYLTDIKAVFRDEQGGQGHFINLEKLALNVKEIDLGRKTVWIKNLKLNTPDYTLVYYKHKEKDTLPSEPFNVNVGWKLIAENLSIDKGHFGLHDQTKKRNYAANGFEFNWFDVNDIQFKAKDFHWDSIMKAQINQLEGNSLKNNIAIKKFKAGFEMKNTGIAAKDFDIEYNNSELKGDAGIQFQSFDDFNDFVNKVYINAKIEKASTNGKDVAVWLKAAEKYVPNTTLSGVLKGTVSNINGENFKITAGNKTRISGSASVKGIPDINKMFIDAKISNLETTPDDIRRIAPYVKLPKEIDLLGASKFSGSFNGLYNDFKAKGTLSTAKGQISVDANMKFGKNNFAVYKGNVRSPGLDLYGLTGIKELGNAAFNLNIDGKGLDLNTIQSKINGEISNVDLNGYRFNSINIAGLFDKKTFNGNVNIDDKSIDLVFEGKVNFNNPERPTYEFYTKIDSADLQALNVFKDKFVASIEGNFKFEGKDLNSINGRADLRGISLQGPKQNATLSDLIICAETKDDFKTYTINSEDVSAHFEGRFDPSTLHLSVMKYLSERSTLLKSPLPEQLAKINSPQELAIQMTVFKDFGIFPLLDSNIKRVDDIRITGNFNGTANDLNLNIKTDSVIYKDMIFKGFMANVEENNGTLTGNAALKRLLIGNFPIRDIKIDASTNLNMLDASIGVEPDSAVNNLNLVTRTSFDRGNIKMEILNSNIKINNKIWKVSENNSISFIDSNIITNNFTLIQDEQSIKIENSSSNPRDARIKIKDFDLADIVRIVDNTGLVQSGTLSGVVNLKDPLKNLEVDGDITIENLKVYDIKVDLLGVDARLVEKNSKLLIGGFLADDEFDLQFNGAYSLKKDDKNPIDIDVIFDKLNLGFLAFPQILGKEISNLKASAKGALKVSGTPATIALSGDASIIDTASVKVNLLGTTLKFANESIAMRPNSIEFFKQGSLVDKNITLFDEYNNRASLRARIEHRHFKDWVIKTSIITDKFNFMNTTYKDNKDFFGKIFASGSVDINGPIQDIVLDINAKSLPNTDFNLVTSSTGDDKLYDFVSFVNRTDPDTSASLASKSKLSKAINGLTLNMNIIATPDAYFKLYLDYAKNDVIRARGNAELAITIKDDNINMSGTYTATSGDYLFSQQDILNKNFTIKEGSTIKWNGNVMDAEMNVDAVYATRAAVRNIVDSTSAYANARIPIDVVLKIGGKLSETDISFEIEPTQSFSAIPEELKARLQSLQQDKNEVNKQVFGILIFGSFIPQNGFGQNSSQAGSIGVDFAINSLTEFFNAKISEYFNEALGMLLPGTEVAIRQGADNTGFTLTKKLSNDRLVINVGGDVQYGKDRLATQANNNNTGLVGDVEVEYMITADGKVRIKAYSRYDNTYIRLENESNLRTGVGLVYQKEFDRINQLFSRDKKRAEKKKEQDAKKAPVPLKNDTIPAPAIQ